MALIVFSLLVCGIWIIAEFKGHVAVRVACGCAFAAVLAFGAYAAGTVASRFQYCSEYGIATANLVDAVIVALRDQRSPEVLVELEWLRTRFHPSYESISNYDKLTDEVATRLLTKEKGSE